MFEKKKAKALSLVGATEWMTYSGMLR